MRPTDIGDLAELDLVDVDTIPDRDWTIICRDRGWDQAIRRKGAAAKAYERNMRDARLKGSARVKIGGMSIRLNAHSAEHCAYPGCGLWVAAGAEFCSRGHSQTEPSQHTVETEEIPF